MSIRLANNSVSVVVRGYAIALWPIEDKRPGKNTQDTAKEVYREPVLVWVDIAPQHPKALNAIWASLVNGTGEYLDIYDRTTNEQQRARGLNRRYHRLQADAPRLAGRARPKHLRLIAPVALSCPVQKRQSRFPFALRHHRRGRGFGRASGPKTQWHRAAVARLPGRQPRPGHTALRLMNAHLEDWRARRLQPTRPGPLQTAARNLHPIYTHHVGGYPMTGAGRFRGKRSGPGATRPSDRD